MSSREKARAKIAQFSITRHGVSTPKIGSSITNHISHSNLGQTTTREKGSVTSPLMKLEVQDQRYHNAVEGWLGLDNWREANEELERIRPEMRASRRTAGAV